MREVVVDDDPLRDGPAALAREPLAAFPRPARQERARLPHADADVEGHGRAAAREPRRVVRGDGAGHRAERGAPVAPEVRALEAMLNRSFDRAARADNPPLWPSVPIGPPSRRRVQAVAPDCTGVEWDLRL